MHISYLVKQLFPSCVWLNGKLQFSVHCGDSYTNLKKKIIRKDKVDDKILDSSFNNKDLNYYQVVKLFFHQLIYLKASTIFTGLLESPPGQSTCPSILTGRKRIYDKSKIHFRRSFPPFSQCVP